MTIVLTHHTSSKLVNSFRLYSTSVEHLCSISPDCFLLYKSCCMYLIAN